MPALRYYFRTFVQQCRLVCGDDHKILRQTEVTSLGQVLVRRTLSKYIPTHAKDFTLAFETPHILRQLCSVSILFVPKAHQVVRVALFKRCFGRTYIYFRSTGAVRFYTVALYTIFFGEAMPVQWTPFRLLAITASGLAVAFFF